MHYRETETTWAPVYRRFETGITCAMLFFVLTISQGCSKKSPTAPPVQTPGVEITSPEAGSAVFGVIQVRVSIVSAEPVSSVELFVDGKSDSSLAKHSPPYVFMWEVPDGPDSSAHALRARALLSDSTVLTSPEVKVAAYRFAPTNLTADQVTETMIGLRWQNNSKFVRRFLIERSVNDSAFVRLDSVGAETDTVIFPGRYTTNVNYSFRVRAASDSSLSRYTNTVTVRIPFPAVFNLHVGSMNDSTMLLTWQDTSKISRTFQIAMGTDGTNFEAVKSSGVAGGLKGVHSAAVIYSYVLGQKYYFRIRSFSAFNISPYSGVADTSAVFLPPAGLALLDSSYAGIRLRWTNGSRFTDGFRIERETGSRGFELLANVSSGTSTYTDSTLDPLQVYRYRVRAENGSYNSDYTSTLGVRYVPGETYRLYRMFGGHTNEVGDVAVSPDNRFIVSASSDRTVRVWSVSTGVLLRTIDLRGSGFTWTPAMCLHGNYLAVGDTQNVVKIYDTDTWEVVKTLATSDKALITGLAFSENGTYLGAVGTGAMTIWRVSDWSVVRELRGDVQYAISFSPDEQFVTAGSTLTGTVSVFQISSGTRTALLETWAYYIQWAVSFSPDGKHIAFGGQEGGVVYVYPSTGGSAESKLSYAPGQAIRCVAYSPGGLLAAGGFGSSIYIWKDGTLVQKLPESGSEIGLAFSRDGTYLVSGSSDEGVRLYRAEGCWGMDR